MKCEINLILITGKIIQTERGGAVCGAGRGVAVLVRSPSLSLSLCLTLWSQVGDQLQVVVADRVFCRKCLLINQS